MSSKEVLSAQVSAWRVFIVFLKLGLTSFGGPIAHLGYFRDEFVGRKRWLSDKEYADLVALCQFLPGPASSQVGIAIGLLKSGYRGALSAWLGFTLPSAIILVLFALGITSYSEFISDGILRGLKIAAVAIVAQAIWGMAKSLCPDTKRITLMTVAACYLLIFPSTLGQITVILLAGLIGAIFFKSVGSEGSTILKVSVSPKAGAMWLLLFVLLFISLPIIAAFFSSNLVDIIDILYRAGSLVFGGGHVVLPLLEAELVSIGVIDNDLFLAGYGVTQAVPGPLFTISAFLGAMADGTNSWLGGMAALVAIFLPSFLLVFGVLPFWGRIQGYDTARAALMGVNASVVGMLIAAFYDPVWVSAILNSRDLSIALIAFVALIFWKAPPWLIVLGSAFIGGLVLY